jgi:hypothetical protein
MTEILINELSLSGQFISADDFIRNALIRFASLLNEIKGVDVLLYKKYDFFQSMVTKNISVHDIIFGVISRQYDEIRKMKLGLVCLFENPYWEDDRKHSDNICYSCNGNCVTGQSLAEACERDRITISFTHQKFSFNCISIMKEETEIQINNLFKENDFIETAWNRNLITCEDYCIKKFKGNKLDFSHIDPKEGFSLLDKDAEKLFIDGFRKFTELTWTQISTDDGFKYDEYKDRKGYFKALNKKIYKFRTSQKYRCFGYVEQGIFCVILFDLTHKYSDFG